VVEEYLSQAKYEEFVRELKAQVDILLNPGGRA
jgi:hypothetical protein